ncbi:MAG: hypothetical protein V4623_06455 [Pseudomonadota bacterium]
MNIENCATAVQTVADLLASETDFALTETRGHSRRRTHAQTTEISLAPEQACALLRLCAQKAELIAAEIHPEHIPTTAVNALCLLTSITHLIVQKTLDDNPGVDLSSWLNGIEPQFLINKANQESTTACLVSVVQASRARSDKIVSGDQRQNANVQSRLEERGIEVSIDPANWGRTEVLYIPHDILSKSDTWQSTFAQLADLPGWLMCDFSSIGEQSDSNGIKALFAAMPASIAARFIHLGFRALNLQGLTLKKFLSLESLDVSQLARAPAELDTELLTHLTTREDLAALVASLRTPQRLRVLNASGSAFVQINLRRFYNLQSLGLGIAPFDDLRDFVGINAMTVLNTLPPSALAQLTQLDICNHRSARASAPEHPNNSSDRGRLRDLFSRLTALEQLNWGGTWDSANLIALIPDNIASNLDYLSLIGVYRSGPNLSSFALKKLDLSGTEERLPMRPIFASMSFLAKERLRSLTLRRADCTNVSLGSFINLEELDLRDVLNRLDLVLSLPVRTKGNLSKLDAQTWHELKREHPEVAALFTRLNAQYSILR